MTDQPERVNLVIGRGRVKAVDDSDVVQRLQIDLGPTGPDGDSQQLVDKVPMVMLFGFGSSPPKDTDVITLHVGGRRTPAIAIGHNNQQYRLKDLEQGDARMYDIRGAFILLNADGITIDAAGNDIVIQNANNITATCDGDVSVTTSEGDVTVEATDGDVTVNASSGSVVVNSDDVSLGATGGPAVARVGDSVDLSTGLITSGSTTVSAAG